MTLVALLLAGLAEGVGLSLLLPTLSVFLDSDAGALQSQTTGATSGLSKVGHVLLDGFAALGLTPTVGTLLVVIVGCITLKSILVLVANRHVGFTVAHVATDLRLTLIRTLLAARWEYYVQQPAGALSNAVASEALRASSAYFHGATAGAFLIQAVVYTGVALLVAWKATLAAIVAGVILLYVFSYLVQKAQRAGARQTQLLKSLITRLTDSLHAVKPLKAMARENLVGPLLESDTTRLNRAVQREILSTEALRSFQEPVLTALIAAGLYVALIPLGMPVPTVIVLALLLARLLSKLVKIQREYQRTVSFATAYWSIQDTIRNADQAHETESKGGIPPRLERAVRLERVGFAYGDAPVLKNVSLSVPSGSFTAIVGPSGVGKTTVADLVTGLLQPQQGEVLIDEASLRQVDLKHWRRMIGYVPQDTLLLHDTVLNNVTLGDPEVNEADAEYALRAAGAWDFVTAMPQGMYSLVGERGTALSGGQRQRIAIARALAHRPRLLIRDEVTRALDRESEAGICRTLQELCGELTILAISHQPAFVEAADRVYRLQNGTVTLSVERSAAAPAVGEPRRFHQTVPGEPGGDPETEQGARHA